MAEKKGRGRPATGQTPNRTVRVPDQVWNEAKEKAEAEGTSVSDVVNDCLRRYLRKKS
jgi:predicted HicB family RNase H-like nuclease